MNEILAFIFRHCSFLWDQAGYRFTDSRSTPSFGGDGYVILESSSLRLRFLRKRGQLFLDVQEPGAGEDARWYSIDIVRRLLTGERMASAELSADYAQFLRLHLSDIEARFSDQSARPETKRRLDELEQIRAKELFG
jgi:hypothetical protein